MIVDFILNPLTSLDPLFIFALFATYYGTHQQGSRKKDHGLLDYTGAPNRVRDFYAVVGAALSCLFFIIVWYYIYGILPFISSVPFQESIYLLGSGLVCLVIGTGVVGAFHTTDDTAN